MDRPLPNVARINAQAAAIRVDWLPLLLGQAEKTTAGVLAALETQGVTREELVELASVWVETQVEEYIRANSKSRIARRCADNFGDGIRWIVARQLRRLLP